jgi:protoporphyrinogen oxidase
VEVSDATGIRRIPADHVWSSIPITVLTRCTHPQAPPEVLKSCDRIAYRSMVLIYLVLDQARFSGFDAHYFPEMDIPITRLSEPKNYAAITEPAGRTVLCAELPCGKDDPYWDMPDAKLGEMVKAALARVGLPIASPVLGVTTRRLPQAYPIYARGYETDFECIDRWVDSLPGVLTLGRQGLFAHDNTHHTLAMAYAAVECLNEQGEFDRSRWQQYRKKFETHVVED